AKAMDNEGAMGFSEPVRILVGTNQPPPPPPTNVVVSISAIDSYASEGPWTNIWIWDTNYFRDTNIIVTWPWHTNISRGTNTAAFVVRRLGPTNDSITVKYHIGGTASNGVDYAELPGEVAIPAGARGARIFVVPLEDGLVEGIETVVLELTLPGGDPPSYAIGFPHRAAAIITDNDAPRPRCIRLADGMFHVCLPGTNGHCVRIEGSHDLVRWVTICISEVRDGAIHFVDPDADGLPHRFYRAVREENCPED
ncbi:MAG: hypothetical protein L0Y58_00710, partial [Verrucomicrobia subdivision 3 bacterium]|nr:hypothetical protein [Limisphaerales bacterium]